MKGNGPYLVLGLGNPGKAYERSRHNAGFMVVEELASRFQLRFRKKWRISSYYCRHVFRGKDVIYIKPRTFMNRSGIAAISAACAFGVSIERVLAVVDDVYLPLGTLRMRRKGSDGGHNGLASMIAAFGSGDFARCRIGIGGAVSDDLADFVLHPFTVEEGRVLGEVLPLAADAVLEWVDNGIDSAMNKYNSFSSGADDGDGRC
jgi:PTH1 family peptidyl-tRNA hydrolase